MSVGTQIFLHTFSSFDSDKPIYTYDPLLLTAAQGVLIGNLRMLTMVIIEEHDVSRDMLAKRFAHRKYQVFTSTDGDTGLSMAQAIQPDLILLGMDGRQPDGWEVAQLLKAQPLTHHIPILALTARVRPQDYQRSLAIGCDDCDTKPVDFQRLLSKVRFLLGEHVCP